MKSKVNPRLLMVLGIALLLVAAFGAVKLLGGSDDAAPAGEEPALDGSTSDEGSPDGAESADAVEGGESEQPIDGTPIVDADDGASDWADQANMICGQAIQDVLSQEAPDTPEEAAELLEKARELVDDLGALEPPPGAEAEAAEFVALLGSSLDAVEELVAMTDGGELEDLDQLSGLIAEQAVAQARLAELGALLGVETCLTGSAGSETGDIVEATTADADSGSRGLLKLQNALLGNESVVLVVYSPSSELDTRVVREARAGANSGGAGFVAINGTREAQVKLLAERFELRETPTTLVVNQSLVVVSRFNGFADRETVAQAVKDSLEGS